MIWIAPCTIRVGEAIHSQRRVAPFQPGNVSVELWHEPIEFWYGASSFERRKRSKTADADADVELNSDADGHGPAGDHADDEECIDEEECVDDDAYLDELEDLAGDLGYDDADEPDPFNEVFRSSCFHIIFIYMIVLRKPFLKNTSDHKCFVNWLPRSHPAHKLDAID